MEVAVQNIAGSELTFYGSRCT